MDNNIRRIDDLARVNIPKEARKVLFGSTKIIDSEGKFLKFEINDNIITLKVVEENENGNNQMGFNTGIIHELKLVVDFDEDEEE